jgi:hypothetical protein
MSKKKYDVSFDFTTVHKGSQFVGRKGTTMIETDKPIEGINWKDEGLISALAQSILLVKPSFKIFMLTVTNIKPLDP